MPAPDNLKLILEAALLAAGRPLSLDALMDLFNEEELPERKVLREARGWEKPSDHVPVTARFEF